MADFALWATACETAIWPSGTYWAAYAGNRDEAVEGVIEADPIAAAVRAMMAERTEWTGTASDLLGALAEMADGPVAKAKTWPDSPRALAGRLRRVATFLRKVGIEVSHEREGNKARARRIRITNISAADWVGNFASTPSTPCQTAQYINGLGADGRADDADSRADDADGSSRDTVRRNPLKNKAADDVDDVDAKNHTHSARENAGWRARL
jgi:hypothetical protein